jgi:hypothetical protein
MAVHVGFVDTGGIDRGRSPHLGNLFPNIKTLFMSGYTANVIVRHGVLDERIHYLQKPFTKQTLTAKAREVLDGNAPIG